MKKFFSVLFIIVIAAAMLVSCGKTDKDDQNTVVLKKVENLSEYVVVRGESSSDTVTALATSLRKAINDATGASVAVKTDYNSKGGYEILVGETKRQQSIDAHVGLKYYDYTIKTDGKKIVIAGGSDKALEDAIELFKTRFIDAEAKTIRAPMDSPFIFKRVHPFDSLSVDGNDIKEFSILCSSSSNAQVLREGICEAIGFELDIVDHVLSESEHYIIIEATELVVDRYSVKVEDGNVIIKGSDNSLEAALDAFIENCLKKTDGKTYDLSSKDNFEGSAGKKEIYTKDQLMSVIEQVYADPNKIIIGEQVKGETYSDPEGVDKVLATFKDSTGQMPGIIGIDLGCYGIDVMETTEADWSAYICDLVDYAADGGIITASAHWENPSSNTIGGDRVRGNFGTDNTLEGYEKAFTDLITEGTEYNDFFKAELDANARFLKALQDNGVPVIWRPLHEANGSWFWYCIIQQDYTLDPSYFINVWKYVYEYLTEDWELTNLIWCYGPNYSANVKDSKGSTMSTTYLYPGDEYCDMVGVDWYTQGNLEITFEDNYPRLTDHARKPGAITEFGPSGAILADKIADQPQLYNCMDLYDNLLELSKQDYSFAYLLTWMSGFTVTAMGEGDEFMETDMTLGQAEVKAMFDALK